MNVNYKLPIDYSRFFESNIRNLSIINEKDSIQQNLELILTTSPGEHKYDLEYGCKIWNLDFERVASRSYWEEQFIQYISEAVKQYEPRLYDIETAIGIVDTKRDELLMKAVFIKTKVNIRIDARIAGTGEKFRFFYSLFLGPLHPD
jgi:phage baseplate assembly protein W